MWRSKAAYAIPSPVREGSTWETGEKAPSPFTFAVTFSHVAPPSLVTCRFPSSVPAQITPARSGDSPMLMTVPWYSAVVFSMKTGPPADWSFSGSFVVRSGLIARQLPPKSSVRNTTFPPKYTVRPSWGEATMGAFQLKRNSRSPTGPPSPRRGCGLAAI